MHLRKAKLMFFWVRYPSSAILKMYFPDIKFNKNNTAQLVKWFSNFRYVRKPFSPSCSPSTPVPTTPLALRPAKPKSQSRQRRAYRGDDGSVEETGVKWKKKKRFDARRRRVVDRLLLSGDLVLLEAAARWALGKEDPRRRRIHTLRRVSHGARVDERLVSLNAKILKLKKKKYRVLQTRTVDKTRRKVIHPNHVGVKLILAFFSSPHAGFVPVFFFTFL